jgi:hypothetical protein
VTAASLCWLAAGLILAALVSGRGHDDDERW